MPTFVGMVPASPSTGAAAVRTAVARAAAPAAPVDQALPTRRVAMGGSHKFLQDLVISGAAAAFSKTVNSPLEVTKLIMQTQPHRFPGGVRELVVQLPKQEGVLAFWQGNATNVLRYFPSQALTFALKGVCEVRSVVPKHWLRAALTRRQLCSGRPVTWRCFRGV